MLNPNVIFKGGYGKRMNVLMKYYNNPPSGVARLGRLRGRIPATPHWGNVPQTPFPSALRASPLLEP